MERVCGSFPREQTRFPRRNRRYCLTVKEIRATCSRFLKRRSHVRIVSRVLSRGGGRFADARQARSPACSSRPLPRLPAASSFVEGRETSGGADPCIPGWPPGLAASWRVRARDKLHISPQHWRLGPWTRRRTEPGAAALVSSTSGGAQVNHVGGSFLKVADPRGRGFSRVPATT